MGPGRGHPGAGVWTAAVVHPVDCGEAKSVDLDVSKRKEEGQANRVL